MAAIASRADVSRQTLYRYYPDVDAVLLGVAELVASHDERFEAQVARQSDPATQLDLIVGTIIDSGDHNGYPSAALEATLPPQAREVLGRHRARIEQLLSAVLTTGIDDGQFRDDLEPSADARLILGLAAAADPDNGERAIALVHQLVDPQPKETST